jgi:hypothetical protein
MRLQIPVLPIPVLAVYSSWCVASNSLAASTKNKTLSIFGVNAYTSSQARYFTHIQSFKSTSASQLPTDGLKPNQVVLNP